MSQEKAPLFRRRARVVALQALYECDTSNHPSEDTVRRLLKGAGLGPPERAFALELVQGAMANLKEINGLIKKYAPAWPVDQITTVDRNILRLAIFEIVYRPATPPKAAINEAVELAKTFGSESSPRFINGVLGSLMGEDLVVEEPRRREKG